MGYASPERDLKRKYKYIYDVQSQRFLLELNDQNLQSQCMTMGPDGGISW
jgi:hypothetical protein